MSKEKSKKAEPTKAQGPSGEFVRLKRVHVPNSHHAAYQIEKVVLLDGEVVSSGFFGNPDMLEMTLAKVQEALDPESVVAAGKVA